MVAVSLGRCPIKWFKHHTDANRDEKLQAVRDEFGVEGYGAYWLVLESIAEQMTKKNPSPEITLSITNWRRITGFSPKKFRKFVTFCHISELFIVNFSENLACVKCDKLVRIRDEWQSRKDKNS